MARALVLLAEGFEEIEAVSAIDVMRRGGIDVVVAALSGDLFVPGSRGMTLAADVALDDVPDAASFDAVVLPGGALGMRNLRADDRVADLLREMNAAGKCVAAICAAPIVLGAAGVISDKRYTCYPSCEGDVGAPNYTDGTAVVEDGNLLTSRGPGTAMAFGVALVRKLAGAETARRVADGLLFQADAL